MVTVSFLLLLFLVQVRPSVSHWAVYLRVMGETSLSSSRGGVADFWGFPVLSKVLMLLFAEVNYAREKMNDCCSIRKLSSYPAEYLGDLALNPKGDWEIVKGKFNSFVVHSGGLMMKLIEGVVVFVVRMFFRMYFVRHAFVFRENLRGMCKIILYLDGS